MKAIIIDYGLGNLFSLRRALTKVGVESSLTTKPSDLETASHIFLPGVGSFGDGISNLLKLGFLNAIRKHAGAGKPILGICLGMQLLLDESEEFGLHQGLGLISGRVIRFPRNATEKIPHIGWCEIYQEAESWEKTILNGQKNNTYMYFVHSYYAVPFNSTESLAKTTYSGISYASVIRRGNIYGCQFHPEKSGQNGLDVLRQFVSLTHEGAGVYQ